MNFTRIPLLLVFLFLFLSCENGLKNKPDLEQQDSNIPSIEQPQSEESLRELRKQKNQEGPVKNEVKKRKLKTLDTLKPLVAIP